MSAFLDDSGWVKAQQDRHNDLFANGVVTWAKSIINLDIIVTAGR